MTLTRRNALWATLFTACGSFAARAQQPALVLEGQPFARRTRVAGVELLLNGVGLRAVAWFKGYAAGLYLTEFARNAGQALALPGPKRLQLRLLVSVSAAEFLKAMNKGIERNTPAPERAALAPQVRRFGEQIAAIGKVSRGDVVDLDLEPGRGLLFSLNGAPRGEAIAGADFYDAVLRSFIGDHPYDNALKTGLLTPPAGSAAGRRP